MPNKCIMGCSATGEDSPEKSSTNESRNFHFPLKRNTHLLEYWEKFTNRGPEWKATKNTVICSNHFEEKYIIPNDRNATLDWKANPRPTIYTNPLYKKLPSLIPTPVSMRKPPRKRNFQEDQMPAFLAEVDPIIKDVFELELHTPEGFMCKKGEDYLLFYRLEFDQTTGFPKVLESIKVDKNLQVQLQFNGDPVPLPAWFVKGRHANLSRVSMLENLPAHIRNVAADTPFTLLDELKSRQNYKTKGRPPYSAAMLRFALHMRYSSAQAYRLLLEKFPMPSFTLLNKLQKGGVDAIKSIKMLLEKGKISKDIVLMVDEMFLQKAAQYQNGEYIGRNEDGQLYKGIVASMVVGLKTSIPYIIQATPEITFTGSWLAETISKNVQVLSEAGFQVRAIVSDNHSTNVNAYAELLTMHSSDSPYYFIDPSSNEKIYLLFDSVHIVKNIRNNLLNGRKFVFPSFSFEHNDLKISCPPGYISWCDLHKIFEKDSKLKGNLKKAPKLTYEVLHPGNKKQSVPLALSIFDETTIAACRSYFPEREDMAYFLELINKWWLISNSKERFHPNPVGSAVKSEDGKTEFFDTLADWIEAWSECPAFTLTRQTSSALIRTLRGQSMLLKDLLNENYDFVLVGRLQSDPLERRFSQYRQMSGGRFLVSLREVQNSERILACRSLIMEDIDFWNEDLAPAKPVVDASLVQYIDSHETEMLENSLDEHSQEVSTLVAGYVSMKLGKRSKCSVCRNKFVAEENDVVNDKYLRTLSRGGLVTPSPMLAYFVGSCFSILDYVSGILQEKGEVYVREICSSVLKTHAPQIGFTCTDHVEWGFKFASRAVINCFFNNAQKIDTSKVRKDSVAVFKRLKREK